MKRQFIGIFSLIAALSLTGCGPLQERLYQIDPADYQNETRADVTAEPQPDTEPEKETEPDGELPEEPDFPEQPDFDSITDEVVLERMGAGKNADVLPNYAAPQGGRDYQVFIPPQDADPLEQLQAEHPDAQLTLLEENEFYALYSAEGSQIPVMLLKQFYMVGNGYAYYSGSMEERDILCNFDLLAHDQTILWRGYRNDPEIKCVSYDFYGITEDASGGVTLGYYCYNIDRDDHLVNVEAPDWNMMRPVGEMEQSGAADPMPEDTTKSDAELDAWAENMEQVDEAISMLTDTDDYKQADADTRREMIVDLLTEFGASGMIVPESIHESEDMVSFEYTGGGGCGVKLTPFDPMCN